MSDIARCKQCSTDMKLQSIGTVSGEEGALKISIQDFPVLVCERGHKHFVARDFPIKLLEHVAKEDEAKLPSGKKEGLLFKKYHCGKCGELLGSEAETKPFGFDVKLDAIPPFRIELNVPVHKCAACGREQLRNREEIQQLTPVALAHGFQAAGLKPEA